MPGTYLLLRDNKQTGPYSLEALLQQHLQPHDLIWVEGQSAGWSYPSEIRALVPYVSGHKQEVSSSQTNTLTVPEQAAVQTDTASRQNSPVLKRAANIYVSLPAGMPTHTEATPAPVEDLEAKATALRQRIEAFAEGRATEDDTETRYARSLDDMKQEYGAWLVQKQAKKKHIVSKRNLVIAASLLVVTTSGFGIRQWMQNRTTVPEPAVADYTTSAVLPQKAEQPTTVSFSTTDSFTSTSTGALPLQTDQVAKESTPVISKKKPATAPEKNSMPKQANTLPPATDTAQAVAMKPAVEQKPVVRNETKPLVPLSRLVTVNGTLQSEGNSGKTDITLQNNSTETLKLVAVSVTFLKKENRQLGNQTVYFYNVQPATAPVITITGNRRATAARFQINTITRSDGSLYLIH